LKILNVLNVSAGTSAFSAGGALTVERHAETNRERMHGRVASTSDLLTGGRIHDC
jgi:hypothetical protein